MIRRSSTRFGPVCTFTSSGVITAHCSSLNQKYRLMLRAPLPQRELWSPWSCHVNWVQSLEHNGWQLPRIAYGVNNNTVTVTEPAIKGQPVTAFVSDMTDRLMCFVEDVVVHCIQRHMPAGLSSTDIPLSQRAAEMPVRFQPTLAKGGMPSWQIAYHASSFDVT